MEGSRNCNIVVFDYYYKILFFELLFLWGFHMFVCRFVLNHLEFVYFLLMHSSYPKSIPNSELIYKHNKHKDFHLYYIEDIVYIQVLFVLYKLRNKNFWQVLLQVHICYNRHICWFFGNRRIMFFKFPNFTILIKA